MKKLVEFSINGEHYELALNSQVTLLEVLREQLGLTGTKEGCGTGECGSWTGLADGKPILSCLTLAAECQGHGHYNHRRTFGGKLVLTSVQKTFLEKGAVQCGFALLAWCSL